MIVEVLLLAAAGPVLVQVYWSTDNRTALLRNTAGASFKIEKSPVIQPGLASKHSVRLFFLVLKLRYFLADVCSQNLCTLHRISKSGSGSFIAFFIKSIRITFC